ncbi:MAG: hypothetical protein JF597_48390, partial [Streptomyces sp.]|uniref:S8 family serine peptidase n=1 Tax=Streptomyces sp. TaxID=1931 RepID=UPI0025E48084
MLLHPGSRLLRPAALLATAALVVGGPAAVAVSSAGSAAAAPAHSARASAPGHHREFATGSVLARFRDGTSVKDQRKAAAAAGARLVKHVGVGAQVLAVASGDEQRAVAALRANALVRYAEPNYFSVPTG